MSNAAARRQSRRAKAIDHLVVAIKTNLRTGAETIEGIRLGTRPRWARAQFRERTREMEVELAAFALNLPRPPGNFLRLMDGAEDWIEYAERWLPFWEASGMYSRVQDPPE